jgi:hypothetical protein
LEGKITDIGAGADSVEMGSGGSRGSKKFKKLRRC